MEQLDFKMQWAELMLLERKTRDIEGALIKSAREQMIDLVREKLKESTWEREVAFRIARSLPNEYKERLLPDLLRLACEPSYVPTIVQARDVILTYPRRWIVEHIESVSEPLLRSSDEWIYRRLLEVYSLLDKELTLRLARRGLDNTNPEICEACNDFIEDPGPRW